MSDESEVEDVIEEYSEKVEDVGDVVGDVAEALGADPATVNSIDAITDGVAETVSGVAIGAGVGSMILPGVGTVVGGIAGGGIALTKAIGDLFFGPSLIEQLLDDMKKQRGYAEEYVYSPTEEMARIVESGEIWQGKGSEAFHAEVMSLLSDFQELMDALLKTEGNTQAAMQILVDADRQNARYVSDLRDLFKQVPVQ